jgi:predicted metalloprotease with PDZ domain
LSLSNSIVCYTVSPSDPSGHYFDVTATVTEASPEGLQFSLPTWIPGSYLIREFAKNLQRVTAEDATGGSVHIEKVGKSTWKSAPCSTAISLKYRVYAWDLSVRTAHLDDTHGFFNGTSLFLCPEGFERHPVTLEISLQDALADWSIATTLPSVPSKEAGIHKFHAPNYDALIDHPVEMGTHTTFTFEACGVPHRVAITGRHTSDIARLQSDLKTICEHHIQFFQSPAPIDEYLFLIHAVGSGYGGLEHRNSTALICNRDDLPQVENNDTSDGYRRFLGLCSHEYLHTWNVKRIKPDAFLPYDLTQETPTKLLWVFEGITSYFDDLALVASGVISIESYLTLLGRQITNVMKTPGRHQQSLAESSFDTWTKLYRPDENSPNTNISYYTKGALVALALDLTLRKESKYSLPDIMREAWSRYGDQTNGVAEGGFEALVQEISGLDLTAFFDAAIRSTTDLPIAKLLRNFGVTLRFRPSTGVSDKGGNAIASAKLPKSDLCVVATKSNGGAKLKNVVNGGPAHMAGLSAGDTIVAVNQIRVSSPSDLQRLTNHAPGTQLEITAFRADILRTTSVVTTAPKHTHAWLEVDEDVDKVVSSRRESWLFCR